MKRQIIEINEEKCNGCGQCIPNCPEGALQIIDGKARLISDLFCDGLGACIGECPVGAIKTVEREAEPYNENIVMENIIKAGPNTIKAHLKHLKGHGEMELYEQAVNILKDKDIDIPVLDEEEKLACGCPGTTARSIDQVKIEKDYECQNPIISQLRQWPVQLHLINPNAQYLKNADLLITADCVPFAFANFHQRFVKGKIVINFCPKLDSGIDSYIEKLAEIFKNQNVKTVTIVRMEVPCCGGIEHIIMIAIEKAGKAMMIKTNVISVDGKIL